jgi:hypothetical protein
MSASQHTAKIGEIRAYLFVPFDCNWNALVREVTAECEIGDEQVDAYEVFKRLVEIFRQNGHLDHSFPARIRLTELFSIPTVALEENYTAWLRWAGDTQHRHLVLCDSDAPGAFKVYRAAQQHDCLPPQRLAMPAPARQPQQAPRVPADRAGLVRDRDGEPSCCGF